jgi:hypothetical protein
MIYRLINLAKTVQSVIREAFALRASMHRKHGTLSE